MVRGTADMHIGLSEVLLERNDLAAALRHLDASTQLGEQAGLPQHAYRWRVARGSPPTGRRRSGGRARPPRRGRARLQHRHVASGATRRRRQGAGPARRPATSRPPRRWASERGLTADDDLSYVREYEHITLARVLLATHAADRDDRSADDAIRLLERLLAAAEEGQRTGSAIEILIVLALAHQARGDHTAATAALEQALARAEPEGYVRIFVDELPALAPLLRATSRQGVAGDHARQRARGRTGRTLDAGPPAGASRQGLVDELSNRELDVLRLLRSDLSGPDIARELRRVAQHRANPHQEHLHEARRRTTAEKRCAAPPSSAS